MVVSDHQSRASRTDRARLKEFKERTSSDDKLQILISTVLEGWPSTLDKVPAEFKPYFQFEDEITAQNSLLFRGERLIAPAKLRKKKWERSIRPILVLRAASTSQRSVLLAAHES